MDGGALGNDIRAKLIYRGWTWRECHFTRKSANIRANFPMPAYPPRVFYRTAAEEGVEIAAREHERQGGEPHQVEIVQLIEWPD